MSSTRSPLDGPPAPKTRMGRLNSVCRAAWNPDRKSYPPEAEVCAFERVHPRCDVMRVGVGARS